jgi:hypothetical protein
MYNMVFGENRMGPAILATLGLSTGDFMRYRDCHVANGKIAVYTRMGGNNREMWRDEATNEDRYDKLTSHKHYLDDQDDDFDNTYATFYFGFPEEFAEDLKKLDSRVEFDPDQRWHDALNALKQASKEIR